MKKSILFLLVGFTLTMGIEKVKGQAENGACGNEAAWQQAITIDPSLVQKRQQIELQIDNYLKNQQSLRTTTDNDEVRIIPLVFHIMHEGGTENISDAQVIEAVQVFNEDYRRLNADTTKTPAAFRPVAADIKVEFRLATKDPNGNCTNGINRVFTHRTNHFDNYAKSIIDWPSDKYLNIWSVKSIGVSSQYGTVIGYAQFPVSGASGTDGVVLQENYVGRKEGTADVGYKGRNGVHEIGHYLDLRHNWGDADCGDDKCNDTPTQLEPNFNQCLSTYPHISCGNNGDMYDNYMDYSSGSCKDIFTKDQKARMRAALDIARFTLWQESNLVATGTDNSVHPACAPKADFLINNIANNASNKNHLSVCAGTKIYFKDNSSSGKATSWNWDFPGGNPSSSTDSIPAITYNNAGRYNATLTVTNSQGSSTVTKNDVLVVENGTGQHTVPFTEDFENSQGFTGDWVAYNDDGGPGWQLTNRASYSGSKCVSIQNFETLNTTAPGSIKDFYTPTFNLTNVTKPLLQFRLSYGQQYSGNTDSLRVDGSINCGTAWTSLKHIGGSALAAGSGGFQPNDFAPNHNQWSLVQIQLPSSYAGKTNVKFRFQFLTSLLSNNIYIDDINVANGTVGINEEENNGFNFNAYPNPASESFTINYVLQHAADLSINLYDLQGRLVRQIENKHAAPGSYESRVEAKSFNLASGVYMIRMTTSEGVISKKLIYTKD